jgi:hypothetical protein
MVNKGKLRGKHQTQVRVTAVLFEECMHGLTTYMQDFPFVDTMSMCLSLNLESLNQLHYQEANHII